MIVLLKELVLVERTKGVKVRDQVGKTGLTDPKILKVEKGIEDALGPLGLKRSIDFIFRSGMVQFTKAEKVTPEVMKALKKFGAK
jgi:hypothetical protein